MRPTCSRGGINDLRPHRRAAPGHASRAGRAGAIAPGLGHDAVGTRGGVRRNGRQQALREVQTAERRPRARIAPRRARPALWAVNAKTPRLPGAPLRTSSILLKGSIINSMDATPAFDDPDEPEQDDEPDHDDEPDYDWDDYPPED